MTDINKVQTDLNGFGKRVQTMEVDQGRHDERIKSIESGQAIIFKKLDSITTKVMLMIGVFSGIQITITILLKLYWQ